MSERPRRYDKADHLALRQIGDHAPPRQGGNCRSLWLAMETLAWEQRQKHHGRAFVTSQPNLAKIACISVATVKRLSAFFEHLGLLTITNRKTSACRWDFSHYSLKYPPAIAHGELRSEGSRSSYDDHLHELVLHSKGGAELPPAAGAASPLALRGNSAPLYKDNPDSVELMAARLKEMAGVTKKTKKLTPAKDTEGLRALRDSLDREGRRCLFKALVRLDWEHEPQAEAIYEAFGRPGDKDEIYGQALYVTYCLKHNYSLEWDTDRVYPEYRVEVLEWLDSMTGEMGRRWQAAREKMLAAVEAAEAGERASP